MESLLHPVDYARKVFFLNAGCATPARGSAKGVDETFLARILALMEELRPGAKMLIYAFERTHDERGAVLWDSTDVYVPNPYVRDIAKNHGRFFEWVASVHPYRADCVAALEEAKREGARAVKWLPSAMGIDPASPLCDRFYASLAKLDLPLISHAGLERAVHGSDVQSWGNPLKLRRALDAGVRVVVAHCASMGEDRDLDKGEAGPAVASFDLFTRMMGEPRYEGRLFGDISAVTQTNRASPAVERLIREESWHPRLLNGSDYPLTGLMPIFSMDYLVSLGLLEPASAPVLTEIRAHNALLFDFVAKRTLRSQGRKLPASVFETRGFFDPLSRTAQKSR